MELPFVRDAFIKPKILDKDLIAFLLGHRYAVRLIFFILWIYVALDKVTIW